MGDNISTCRGITSVLWRVFSTVEGYFQYCGGITAVHVGDSFSSMVDTFSTVEVVQYSGDNISTVGDSFSTVEVI